MQASKLNWSDIQHFKASEFPSGVLDSVDSKLIHTLDAFRKLLGAIVTPSPVAEGWVRKSGSKSSQHYAVDRLSLAGDVFPNCDIFYAALIAVQAGFTGVGIYFDTKLNGNPKPMLHVDMRDGPLVMWVRDKSSYTTICPRPSENKISLAIKESLL